MVKWRAMLLIVMHRPARFHLVMDKAKVDKAMIDKAMIGLVRMVLGTIDLDETAGTTVPGNDRHRIGMAGRSAAARRTAREMA